MEYPFILGTAGHIDHGKTSLVKALTGVDCDRLEEEKRRGITIELGFAPLHLPDGKTISIVDVPGHERFIRQMAAGASGMDAGILVIAANEGVMPQTREHLAILTILGVRRGIIALTKKDLVDAETLEIAAAEAAELARGSCLEGAPLVPVSSATGDGIAELAAAIARILDTAPPRKGFGAFFLPIDRVFVKKGFGSIVTGTAFQGSVSEGEEVEILPAGLAGRARAIQTHGTKAGSVQAGQRAALNLPSVQMKRGDAVCAKGAFIATGCIGARLEVLPSAAAVQHRQRVRLHVGTADVTARIALLAEGETKTGIPPGGAGPVHLLTEAPVTVAAGQRFIIRFYSPLATIGGGQVMLPNACPARGKAGREAKGRIVEDLGARFGPVPFLAALVRDRGILSAAGLFELSQMTRQAFEEHLAELSGEAASFGLLEFGKSRQFIDNAAFERAARAAQRILHQFHTASPELAGLEAEKLRAALEGARIAGGDFKDLLGLMAARNYIVPAGSACYRLADFRPAPDAKFLTLVERVKSELAAAAFNLVKLSDLEAKLTASPADVKRAAAYLRERNELWLIEGALPLSREVRDRLLAVLAALPEITVAALRDALGVNRKLALALLDFLDTQGLTRPSRDTRGVSRRLAMPSDAIGPSKMLDIADL